MPRSALRKLGDFAAAVVVLVLPWLFSSSLHGLLLVAAASLSPLAAPPGAAALNVEILLRSADGLLAGGPQNPQVRQPEPVELVETLPDKREPEDSSPPLPSNELLAVDNIVLTRADESAPEEPAPLAKSAPPSKASDRKKARSVKPAQATARSPKTPTGQTDFGDGSGDLGPQDLGSGSNRGAGGKARTGVFGAVGEGYKFVYVFDRSGSMDENNGAPLKAAKAELLASIDDLDKTHQFQIIFYNETPRVFNPTGTPGRLVFGTPQNKQLARKFVGGITADGGTQHQDALLMALRMAPDVIFFLTDANEPRLSSSDLAKIAARNRGTTIHTIEFGPGRQLDKRNFLDDLARQNAGEHIYVDVTKLPRGRK